MTFVMAMVVGVLVCGVDSAPPALVPDVDIVDVVLVHANFTGTAEDVDEDMSAVEGGSDTNFLKQRHFLGHLEMYECEMCLHENRGDFYICFCQKFYICFVIFPSFLGNKYLIRGIHSVMDGICLRPHEEEESGCSLVLGVICAGPLPFYHCDVSFFNVSQLFRDVQCLEDNTEIPVAASSEQVSQCRTPMDKIRLQRAAADRVDLLVDVAQFVADVRQKGISCFWISSTLYFLPNNYYYLFALVGRFFWGVIQKFQVVF